MDGFPSKLSGDMNPYNCGTTTHNFGSTGIPTTMQQLPSTPSFMAHSNPSNQLDDNSGLMAPPGIGMQEEMRKEAEGGGSTGKKKKKKQKSGDNSHSTVAKAALMEEEDLVDAAIPLITENQGVEDLLFPPALPPPGGTIIGGQYLLSNSLLDQILTEKKMQLMQSPEVIEFLKNQKAKK